MSVPERRRGRGREATQTKRKTDNGRERQATRAGRPTHRSMGGLKDRGRINLTQKRRALWTGTNNVENRLFSDLTMKQQEPLATVVHNTILDKCTNLTSTYLRNLRDGKAPRLTSRRSPLGAHALVTH